MKYDRQKAVAALDAFQKSTGLKDFPWEKASGVGEGTLRRFRNGDNVSMTDSTYEKLAGGAAAKLGRAVDVGELRGEGTVQLPVRTITSAGDEVVDSFDGDEPFDWEPAPTADLRDGEVTEVRGRSMLPAYEDGDRLFHKHLDPDPRKHIGRLVVAKLRDGRRFVKVLQSGGKRGRYTLVSLNPAYEPMIDQPVVSVARIVWVKKVQK